MVVVATALTGARVRRARRRRARSGTGSRPARFHVEVGFYVDNLTACLLIVVTTIGMLVHIYSIGYMSHDPGYWRFFAYLNLFMFSMLLLVLGRQLPRRVRRLGAGRLSSYLLIGFWYRKRTRRPRREEGVHRQPRRRRRLRARDHGHLGDHRDAQHPGLDPRPDHRDARSPHDPGQAHRPARLRRRGGQERPVPAPRLAAGRDGGPDAGLGPHPCRDDGQRRRLPRRPGQPDLRAAPRRRWSSSPRSASSPRSSPPRSR